MQNRSRTLVLLILCTVVSCQNTETTTLLPRPPCGCPQIPEIDENAPLPPAPTALASYIRWKLLCFNSWFEDQNLFQPTIIPEPFTFTNRGAFYTTTTTISNLTWQGFPSYFSAKSNPEVGYANIDSGYFYADYRSHGSYFRIDGNYNTTGIVDSDLPFAASGSATISLPGASDGISIKGNFNISEKFVKLDRFDRFEMRYETRTGRVLDFNDPSLPSNLVDTIRGNVGYYILYHFEELFKYKSDVVSVLSTPLFEFLTQVFSETPFLEIVKTPAAPNDWDDDYCYPTSPTTTTTTMAPTTPTTTTTMAPTTQTVSTTVEPTTPTTTTTMSPTTQASVQSTTESALSTTDAYTTIEFTETEDDIDATHSTPVEMTTNPTTEITTEPVPTEMSTHNGHASTTEISTSVSSTTTETFSTTGHPVKQYTACELAQELTYLFQDTADWNEQLENWLCLSDQATSFNGAYKAISPSDERKVYYGVFKISNQWCSDGHNSSSPCNIECSELLENLEPNMRCSQHIFQQSGFQEWSEFDSVCFHGESNYLNDCRQEPYFGAIDNPEFVKVFGEFNENRNMSWAARGYPPPELDFDADTTKYIEESGGRISHNLSKALGSDGNWTMRYTVTFAEVIASDDRIFTCNARNIAGSSSRAYAVTVVARDDPNQESFWTQPTIIGGALGLSLLGLLLPLAYIFIRRRRKVVKLQNIYEQFKYGNTTGSAEGVHPDPNYLSCLPENAVEVYQRILDLPFSKELEIQPHRLTLHELLGSGAFGVVYRGELDNRMVVAVKTVAKDAEEFKLTALLSEVKIMSYVGKHQNIVQLLGVQFADLRQGIVYVAVEYCCRGSLEEFLHKKRKDLSRPPEYFGPVFNVPGYTGTTQVAKPLSTTQLLVCSHQVCGAMEFLASKRIIHGDLAARNVLLDFNYVAKISDFGLSRQIYDNNKKYVLAPNETALPWRSLAIETLRQLKFSTESDVWAFGVFLWEVFSLAEVPYTVGVTWSPEFVKFLESGFRLEIPEFATPEIYQLMRKCWEAEPADRINFQELSIQLLCLHEMEVKKKPNVEELPSN